MALSAVEQRLIAAIAARAGDLLEDLRLHVAIPTGPGATGLDESRQRLTDRLRDIGGTYELVPGAPRPDWLYGGAPGQTPLPTAVCRRTARGRRFLLVGHLDTVHPSTSAFRELTLSSDGRTATGPGCVDMKGGLVVLVAALEAIQASGIDLNWTVALNSDEETGSYYSEPVLTKLAQSADVGLVVEPALPDGSLVVQRPGSGQFMIEVAGRSAHVGRDFRSGVSAVTALARSIVAVNGMSDVEAGAIVNIGPVEGGQATNVVPDRARAWGNVRFANESIARMLENSVRSIATAPGAMPSVRVETSFNRSAKPLTPATQSIAEAAQRAAIDLGQRLPFGSTGGVCDGNILQAAGLPTIDTLGVRGGGLHTPQEWIEIASLVERCQLLAVLLTRLAA